MIAFSSEIISETVTKVGLEFGVYLLLNQILTYLVTQPNRLLCIPRSTLSTLCNYCNSSCHMWERHGGVHCGISTEKILSETTLYHFLIVYPSK